MIKGIGVDIIEIDRIAKAIDRRGPHFIERLFTPNERLTSSDNQDHLFAYYAGRFAAKEAVVKALGTGFRGITWHDIEVLKDPLGKPWVTLSQNVQEKFDNPRLLITISHSKTTACAFCIWES